MDSDAHKMFFNDQNCTVIRTTELQCIRAFISSNSSTLLVVTTGGSLTLKYDHKEAAEADFEQAYKQWQQMPCVLYRVGKGPLCFSSERANAYIRLKSVVSIQYDRENDKCLVYMPGGKVKFGTTNYYKAFELHQNLSKEMSKNIQDDHS